MAFEGIKERLVAAVTGKKGETMESAQDQTSAEKVIVDYVKTQVDEIRNSANRIVSEGQWLTNSAYMLGYTNLFYDTSLRMFRPVNNPGRNVRGNRVEFNYILPNIQNRLARLTKSPPRYSVRPNSTSDDDREAARLGLYVINQVWDQQRVNKKRLVMTMAMQQCGHAFLKCSWDPSLGPKIQFMDKSESGEEVVKAVTLGDVRIDVCSPFEVFVDPLAKSHEEVNHLIHAKIRPLSYFRTQYPERGHLVKAEDVWLTSLEYEKRINSFNAQVGTGSGVGNSVENSAIELMLYEKPSYKHPMGRHIIVANGVLLKDDDLPIDEIPFAKFDDIIIAGKYNSESVITHLRPLQDQYNRNLTKRSQWINRMLNGKYLVARGSGLKQSALNDQSGEVVEFDAVPNAPAPTIMNIPSIPQYAYTEDDYIKGQMNEICGVGEISKGNLPSAGIPAIGMQFLQEMDDTRIGTITENNEYGYADVGRFILKFAHKYYTYPRTLKIAGKGMEYAVKSLKGDDLRGNYDCIVVRDSTLPGSKVLRRQEILNLHQGGYLGDPTDPQVLENVLQMLEYGDVADVWKDYSLDKAQIDQHIEMIENGQKPPVVEFDNHGLFIKELNRYRKSDKFKALPDESQTILLAVMNEHLDYMVDLTSPETADVGMGKNPMEQESTAAQEAEAELLNEEMPMEEMPDVMADPIEGEPV
jgi:hypothetical protein